MTKLALILLGLLFVDCDGHRSGDCYENGTCNKGLICVHPHGQCWRPEDVKIDKYKLASVDGGYRFIPEKDE